MSGKIELISSGDSDSFLNGNPEITLFKFVYKRYTNFAIDLLEFPLDNTADFGTISSFKLPKVSDLLHRVYLKATIPEFYINKNNTENNSIYLEEQQILNANYTVLKALFKANMDTFNVIKSLYENENVSSDSLFTIMDNNIQIFESSSNSSGESYKNLILSIVNNSDLQKVKVQYLSNYRVITKQYLYSNTKGTINISSDNIKSYITNTLISDVEYKKQIYLVSQKIINTIYKLDSDYVNLINQNEKNIIESNINRYNFAWVKRLGHAILNYCEIWIGGHSIDKQYGQWLDIWWELAGNKNQENSYMQMIGDIPELTTFNNEIKPEYTLYVPLQFWFCKYISSALPTIAMNSTDIIFKFHFRKFSELSYCDLPYQTFDDDNNLMTNGTLDNIINEKNLHLNISLLLEIIYLDSAERKKFARASHEYLIEQIQYNIENISLNYTLSSNLNFRHPCTGIVWIIQKQNYLKNSDNTNECLWTTYTLPNPLFDNNISELEEINPLTLSKLTIDNVEIANFDINYFNYVLPYQALKNSPKSGINSYWFSLFPNKQYPSGSCNLSHIKNIKLEYKFNSLIVANDEDLQETYLIKFYAINYNILRISSGIANVAYI